MKNDGLSSDFRKSFRKGVRDGKNELQIKNDLEVIYAKFWDISEENLGAFPKNLIQDGRLYKHVL